MLRVARELDIELAAEAKRRGVSKSSVVRQLIADGLSKRRRDGSVYDRAKDLAGSAEGPGDLSTNPKYMEGFGE